MASLPTENAKPVKALVSWKEIAAFLGRAERTVKRWERERGLPVHRVPGGERGSVYAYPRELADWLKGKSDELEAYDPARIEPAAGYSGLDTEAREESSASQDDWAHRIAERPSRVKTQRVSEPARNPAHGKTPPVRFRREWIAAVVLLAVTGLAGVSLVHARHARQAASSASSVAGASQNSADTPSHRAEEFYLQGRYEWNLRTAESLAKAIDAYTQAIVADPAYAQAYAGLAEVYDLLPEFGGMDRSEASPRAKAAADKAIELDPELAAGHRAKAFALFYGDWDVPGSDAEFRRALALAPNEAETHHWYATTLYSRQERGEALAQIDEALRLAPTSFATIADAAFLHASFNDRREASVKTLRELARTQANFVEANRYLASLDFEDGDYANYVADLRRAASISRDPDELSLATSAEKAWTHGGAPQLLSAVFRFDKQAYAQGTETGFLLGKDFLRLGDPGRALQAFNSALVRNDIRMMVLHNCDCVTGLSSNPGYRDLFLRVRERMKLPPADKVEPPATNQQVSTLSH